MPRKKKILQAAKEEKSYFVSLRNPLELRRHLLESARKSVYSLQSYQKILLLRERKSKELVLLRQSLKELLYLDKKLNEKLPEHDTELLRNPRKVKDDSVPINKSISKKPIKKVESEKKVEQPKPQPIKEKTDLEKLEESLSSIEQKLQNINQ
jgi:hypothetical protein